MSFISPILYITRKIFPVTVLKYKLYEWYSAQGKPCNRRLPEGSPGLPGLGSRFHGKREPWVRPGTFPLVLKKKYVFSYIFYVKSVCDVILSRSRNGDTQILTVISAPLRLRVNSSLPSSALLFLKKSPKNEAISISVQYIERRYI